MVQLESLLSSKQADLQQMGLTEQTWLQDAQCLRDAVASTLDALGDPPLNRITLPRTAVNTVDACYWLVLSACDQQPHASASFVGCLKGAVTSNLGPSAKSKPCW